MHGQTTLKKVKQLKHKGRRSVVVEMHTDLFGVACYVTQRR
jgi:hypothetical protein